MYVTYNQSVLIIMLFTVRIYYYIHCNMELTCTIIVGTLLLHNVTCWKNPIYASQRAPALWDPLHHYQTQPETPMDHITVSHAVEHHHYLSFLCLLSEASFSLATN